MLFGGYHKIIGDNVDAVYYFTQLRGEQEYVIKGRRFDSCYLSFSIYGGKPNGEILDRVAQNINHTHIEFLEPWLGRYKLNREVPGIGEYFIEISLEGDKLRVDDPNDGEVSLLTPLKPASFIDLRNGDEVEFSVEGEQVGCLWNGYFQFYKVPQ